MTESWHQSRVGCRPERMRRIPLCRPEQREGPEFTVFKAFRVKSRFFVAPLLRMTIISCTPQNDTIPRSGLGFGVVLSAAKYLVLRPSESSPDPSSPKPLLRMTPLLPSPEGRDLTLSSRANAIAEHPRRGRILPLGKSGFQNKILRAVEQPSG